MPFKHQSNSYRNKEGILYLSWGDFPDKQDAMKELAELRKTRKAFYEKHDGYYRIFVNREIK